MPVSLRCLICLLALWATPCSRAQLPPEPLDPTRAFPPPTAPEVHSALPEQYLWTAGDVTVLRPDRSKFPWSRPNLRIDPHFFRIQFHIGSRPSRATLYLAGPREAEVFLNGQAIGVFRSDPDAPIGFHVFHAEVAGALHPGDNVLAIRAIRGRGIVSAGASNATLQLAYGEILAAKIVPAAFGVEAPALVVSDPAWRSSAVLAEGWSTPGFNDTAWAPVQTLGPVDSNIEFYQWSADAGMYGWPGYRGLSAPLRTFALLPAKVTHVFEGAGGFSHPESLSSASPSAPFAVTLPRMPPTDAEAPTLLLDFGREVAGRLLLESASPEDATISVAYGESELEALATGLTSEQQGGNYLGTNLLEVPGNGIARGPKSAFRYVRLRFLRGAPTTIFRSIRLEGIYFPVAYGGSFESSDPLLNRIWETGAYTAHLCMQDGLWDAPKRDRGRWVGDIDVEGRVLSTVFADNSLTEDTLRRLAEGTPAKAHVNGIPSYTALWLTSLQTLYQHSGDQAFVASQHAAILQLLGRLDADLGPDNLLHESKGWGFVDWAPGLYGFTPEAVTGSTLQYLRGLRAGAALLTALGDTGAASRYAGRADAVQAAAAAAYLRDGTAGHTWQLNSLAVLDGLSPHPDLIWENVLSHVKQDSSTDPVISPYFGAYMLDAMSALRHQEAALAWVRTYWGGMLAEGATSFWESYDLRWPKGPNFALSLQADGTSGYFVSLAHGWSSGPTAWLSENILGVTPVAPGYGTVRIAPHLLDLSFARGAVPTPHGPIVVSVEPRRVSVDLPAGVTEAQVTAPDHTEGTRLLIDGQTSPCAKCSTTVDGNGRNIVTFHAAGHHELAWR